MQLALRVFAATAIAGGVALGILARQTGLADITPTLLVIVAPGALVLLHPVPRAVGLWGMIAWFVGLLFALTGWYGEPVWLAHTIEVFLIALLALLPAAAFGSAALCVEPIEGEPSPLARRLRSVAATAIVLGIVLAVIGFLPGESRDGIRRASGGAPLVLFVSLAISPALFAYADPRLRTGWRWMMWGLGLAAPAGALFIFALSDYGRHVVKLWPRHVVEIGIGTMLVLILIVLPIILVASDDETAPPTLPRARVR